MSVRHSMELADTIAAERARWAKTDTGVVVDRATPRWQRVRASLCEHHGLGSDTSLDEYADLVVGAIGNTTAPDADPGRTLRVRGQEGE